MRTLHVNTPIAKRLNKFASRKRRRIAVGLDSNKPLPDDLGKAQTLCDVVCVGRRVNGCESVDSATPEETLLDLLLDGKVDGVVRGQLDHTKFVEHLHARQGLKWANHHLVSLLRYRDKKHKMVKEFWLAPVSNTECWIKREKLQLLKKLIPLQRKLGLKPQIAVIGSVRKEDLGPQWYFDGMYYDCEEIVAQVRFEPNSSGWITHYGIATERALTEDANILLMPNGMVGNQCYRLLVYTNLMECLVNLFLGAKLNIVTCSRDETKLVNYFRWAAAVANGMVDLSVL